MHNVAPETAVCGARIHTSPTKRLALRCHHPRVARNSLAPDRAHAPKGCCSSDNGGPSMSALVLLQEIISGMSRRRLQHCHLPKTPTLQTIYPYDSPYPDGSVPIRARTIEVVTGLLFRCNPQ